jgi:predicted RNA-binding protein with PUA-like domain
MNYWLMKSEPNVYSINNLEQDQQTIWDGVRNYQARNFLRQMQPGDLAFFYHSKTKTPGIVGLMRIVKTHVIDPTQFDPNSQYYDCKSTPDNPRWETVIVEFVNSFSQVIELNLLRQKFSPDEFLLLRKGNRLSVIPVKKEIALTILLPPNPPSLGGI